MCDNFTTMLYNITVGKAATNHFCHITSEICQSQFPRTQDDIFKVPLQLKICFAYCYLTVMLELDCAECDTSKLF